MSSATNSVTNLLDERRKAPVEPVKKFTEFIPEIKCNGRARVNETKLN